MKIDRTDEYLIFAIPKMLDVVEYVYCGRCGKEIKNTAGFKRRKLCPRCKIDLAPGLLEYMPRTPVN